MKEKLLSRVGLGALLALGLAACASGGAFNSGKPLSQSADGGSYSVPQTIPSFSDYIMVETQLGDVAPRIVNMDRVGNDLSQYDVVFVGEAHGHTASHLVQMQIFKRLYAKNKNLSLSMEQFERSQQHIVDQYLAGEIGEQVLRDEGKAWDHYTSSYRPLVEFAKVNSLPVIASEVPANMVSCVGEEGPAFLDRIKGEPRTWIADKLNLQDGPYKDRYMAFLESTAGHRVSDDLSEEEKAETSFRRFAAQVSRDDTMAESIYLHLQENPGRQVMHIDGSFHSAALLGTVERLLLRDPTLKVANVHPVIVDDPANPTLDASLLGEGQFLALIQPTPKQFVQMKNINAFVKRTMAAIDENRCAY